MSSAHLSFCGLPLEQQLPLVWAQGTLLAARLEGAQVRTLYQLHNFFCELHYDSPGTHVLALHCYTTTRGLDDYSDGIELPELRGLLP